MRVQGWIKRGPNGIVGTNIMDSKDTVASILEFLDSDAPRQSRDAGEGTPSRMGRAGLAALLRRRNVAALGWRHFLNLAAAEAEPGRLRSAAQPREKFLSVAEMLRAAR